MKNELRGIALLLFSAVLAICGNRMDEVLALISLPVGVLGVTVAFWEPIAALWQKITADTKEKDNS